MGRTGLCLDRRSPHGERGLKFHDGACLSEKIPSLPSRGAWIEIGVKTYHLMCLTGRSPHGERGLKSSGQQLVPGGEEVAPLTGSVD